MKISSLPWLRWPQLEPICRLGTILGVMALGAAALLVLTSCEEDMLKEALVIDGEDLRPPQLLGLAAVSPTEVEARFSKAAWLDRAGALVSHSASSSGPAGSQEVPPGGDPGASPEILIDEVEDGGPVIRIKLAEKSVPGERYVLDAIVKDERGNSCGFIHEFYGFNDRLPELLINEVILSSSTRVYTQAEIVVLAGGNMGGVTFIEGTRSIVDKKFVFPAFEVEEGDYILLHFNTLGAPGEIDETQDKTLATGKGASDTAFDFWAPGTGNLSPDNDVLSLYTNPEGSLIDGFMYSSRVYEEGMKYNGFGTSAMLGKAQELVAEGGWRIAGVSPFPEDAFSPKGSTSLRSICRSSTSADTDSKEDWHIVPPGESSPGGPNSDAVYTP